MSRFGQIIQAPVFDENKQQPEEEKGVIDADYHIASFGNMQDI